MAQQSDNSQNEFDPRHRIVGAIILVSLAVILLPRVLDKQDFTDQTPGSPVSGKEPSTKVVVTTVENLTKPQADDNNTEANVADNVSAESIAENLRSSGPTNPMPVPETKQPEPVPVTQSAIKASAAEPAATPEIPALKKGWVVQLGTYSNPDNAKRLKRSLDKFNDKVYLEEVRVKQGKMLRVRVGPYDSREAADSIQASLQKQAKVQGVVMKLP